jgi:hypothetical protein
VGGRAIDRAAAAAGMAGWRRDTSDPVYTLGESKLTAGDLARLFGQLDTLLPRRHRAWARGLLGSVQGTGRFGFVDAGLEGTVLSKGGWSPETDGWTVNQGAQVELSGERYGVAVVLGAQTSFEAGQNQIRARWASASARSPAATSASPSRPGSSPSRASSRRRRRSRGARGSPPTCGARPA